MHTNTVSFALTNVVNSELKTEPSNCKSTFKIFLVCPATLILSEHWASKETVTQLSCHVHRIQACHSVWC